MHILCIFLHIFFIFRAYYLHISAYLLHMIAYLLHMSAYFLYSCAYFWHMFSYSMLYFAYLLHMPASRLRPCFSWPPDPRPCLASGGGQARLRHANGSASGPHHPSPPNTSHQSSRISGPSVETTAPPAPCGPADCRPRSASQAFHPSASCSRAPSVSCSSIV